MSVINQYLKNLPAQQKKELGRVHQIVKDLAPDTTETFSYGIPTYKYKGKNLVHFAAYKNHMSLFPGPAAIEALKAELSNFKLSKGTIQFTTEQPIPTTTLKKIIQIRKSSIDGQH